MANIADMEKAYHRVKWVFVLKVMEIFYFWDQAMYSCFLILINGCPHDKIYPTQGICQGDPLSPSLFILYFEILSRLMMKEERHGRMRGIKLCRGALAVSHILFANGLLLFVRATLQESLAVESCLGKYMNWEMQTLNKTKSSIHFSKKLSIKAKHLGLPFLIL